MCAPAAGHAGASCASSSRTTAGAGAPSPRAATTAAAGASADGLRPRHAPLRRRDAPAGGLLHRHQRLHRLQGLRGRLQGVEPDPGLAARLHGRVLRQHDRPRRRHVAPRRLRRAAQAARQRPRRRDARADRRARHDGRRDGPADLPGRRGHALADGLRRLQALHARGLPRDLPDRRAVPHGVRHVRRARPARGGRPRLEVHALLRPAQGRHGARVRAGVPDQLDPVRRARRPARARRGAARDPAGGGPSGGAALRRRRGRRRRRLRRLLPAARRARGLRPASGSRRHGARPGEHLDLGGRRGRGAGRGDRRGRAVGWAVSTRPPVGAGAPGRRDRPVIKEPVWKPEIPLYLYTGGLAGASAGVGLLCALRDEAALARRAWALALAGSLVSPALLISDLGVPARFLYMLRMFKVTSPMSVGAWILAGFGATTAPAAAHALTGGALGRPGRLAQFAAATLGLPLSSYTGALLANTAVPAWHDARRELPFLFCAGAAASSGAALTALSPVGAAAPARRLAVGGAAAELAVSALMERRLSRRGTGGAYHEPSVQRLVYAATGLTAAGATVIAARGARSRAAAIAGGALVSAGAVGERWAVFLAGRRSAARARDTVAPQRARIERGGSRGAARRVARVEAPPRPADDRRPGERPVGPGSPAIPPGA